MSQKAQKPTLTGQRIKTRKRDEKEKYDPTTFRDQIVAGLNETNKDLEEASKFLIQSGSKLDFRRYAEALFDILITGGILAPGGTIVDENNAVNSELCIFKTNEDVESMRGIVQLCERMIRQYKYLEKSLDDEMKKVIQFMKGFTEKQRERLTIATYLFITSGLSTAACLAKITNEHLVKDGIALEFARMFFTIWLKEKDFASLIQTLKKAELDGKLLELFPMNKRSLDAFVKYFTDAGLNDIAMFQQNQCTRNASKELKSKLKRMVNDEAHPDKMVAVCSEYAKEHHLPEHDISVLIWNTVMNSVEWNKKEDLLMDQALRHLKNYTGVLEQFTNTPKSESALMLRVQEYCYDNMSFLKIFQKIIMLLYKSDVLAEDTIIKWYTHDHGNKGKTVFLEQLKKMVQWLQSAEEESSEEEDDDEEEK